MDSPAVIRRVAVVAVVVGLAAGCDDGPLCPADEVRRDGTVRPECASAWELSRRTTPGLTPTQAEIDDALALALTAGAPIQATLGYIPVAAPWFGPPIELRGAMSNPALAAAWSAGTVATGVPAVDAVLDELDAISVDVYGNTFQIRTRRAIAVANVQRALGGVPGLTILVDEVDQRLISSDVVVEGFDAAGAHTFFFQLGWTDCPLACAYQHFWRTQIRPDGSAVLTEDWGDPLPR